MKCPLCAEEVRDEAIVCRFCGATRDDGGGWSLPARAEAPPAPSVSGRSTIVIAGVLFLLSGVLEMADPQAPVILFGAERAGPTALVYHVGWLALFGAMGIGLILMRRWGLSSLFVGTCAYTADKAQALLSREAQLAAAKGQLRTLLGGQGLVAPSEVVRMATLVGVLSIVCWWGFALYAWTKRRLFEPRST